MQKTAQKNDFSQGNIPSTIARMAVPLIAAQLINVLYSVVDRIYIARIPHVGLTVLAGVGLTFPIVTLISAFTALAGQGGAPLFSMARGEGDDERASRIMGNSMLMLLFLPCSARLWAIWSRRRFCVSSARATTRCPTRRITSMSI